MQRRYRAAKCIAGRCELLVFMEQRAEFLRGGRSTLEKLAQAIVHPVIFEVELERIRAQVGNGVVSDLSAAIRTRDRVTLCAPARPQRSSGSHRRGRSWRVISRAPHAPQFGLERV